MKIEQITLKNFLSHESSQVSFKGNINAIVGVNGAGKSSIIDGIVFSLFREPSRGNMNNLIRKGKKTSTVEIVLSDNSKGKIYTIRRNIPASTEDSILENSKPLAYRSSEVSQKVQEILHLDKDILLSTVIVRQGDIESIFKDLADVMKKVMKLENLEKLTDSNGPIFSVKKELEMKLENLQKDKEMYESKIAQKKDLEKEIDNLNNNLKSLEAQKEEKTLQLNQLQKNKEEEDKKRERYIELKAKLENANTQLNKIKEDVKDLEEKMKIEQELDTELKQLQEEKENLQRLNDIINQLKLISQSIKDNNNQLQKLSREIDEYKENLHTKKELEDKAKKYEENKQILEQLKRKYLEYNKIKSVYDSDREKENNLENELQRFLIFIDINKLQNDLDKISERIQNLNTEKGQKEESVNQLLKIIKNLNDVHGNICPVCGRELDEEHKKKIREESETKIKDIKIEIQKIEKELRDLNEEKRNIETKIKKALELKAKKESKEKELNDLKEKIIEEEKTLNQLKDSHDKYESIEKELEELEQYYKKYLQLQRYTQNELEEKEKNKQEILQRLDELNSKYSQLRSQLTIPDEEISRISFKISQIEKEYNNKQGILIRIKAEIERKKKELDDIKEIDNEIQTINAEILRLDFDEAKYNELINSINTLNQEVNSMSQEISRILGKLEADKKSLEQINSELEKLKTSIDKIPQIEKGLSKLEKLRNDLSGSGLQNFIISNVKPKIENNLNDILSMFNLSFSRVSVDFEIGGKSKKGKTKITAFNTAGYDLDIEMLSGGERISIALALRLAIARALLDEIGFMILDEPTIHLDEERRRELLNIIRSAMSIVPQIIIVTHDDEVKEISDYIINVYKKGDSSAVKEGVSDDQ
ncbi:DNA double-strand break repair ATPase Rad50 [Acidianus manzaensis]|uniref:DNA double-strand break repair Rad50 ATPase n=1 Tax=Acidianus manzaensis TaxID=282676 RepID=A0A1W6JXP2_9CREN|nr:DNA double-strand break repair ATPase Rad50 [Acidianus manzaensis]ARM75002.1 hypothetical protein B6F84_02470 [Acidianus manzaensis]